MNSFRFGSFQLNSDGTLWCEATLVPLSPMQRRLLLSFCRRPRQVITKETLMLEVWGHTDVSEVSLARTIHGLRRRLSGNHQGSDLIRNVYGEGYLFTSAVEAPHDEPAEQLEPTVAPQTRTLLKV
ncbi:MAG: winged helix-turn-helix domain-containing protein [Synechococcaceae cyanobacterium]|nr:winged helix-turn-helix domain-containing protein [Synechococcaceae cyanobacterium]